MAEPDLLIEGPPEGSICLVLAHGASSAMASPGMAALADGFAAAGVQVARFEFPYMRRRRETGKGGAPDRPAVLEEAWLAAARAVTARLGGGQRLAVGGRSMGGRVASMVADRLGAAAVVCFGYPFHPPGRPEKTRTAHLANLATPALILQGERDTFGNPDDGAGYRLAETIRVHWIADGDHTLKPRKSSGRTLEENTAEAVAAAVQFLAGL